MRTNPNQLATVDIWKLQEHVKDNPVDSNKLYRGLSNLVSTAYIPSLDDLNALQKKLNEALQERNLQAINQMKGDCTKLLDTCFDDLCTWCKSAFDDEAYKALEQSKNQSWGERIEAYKNQVKDIRPQSSVNPVFNENLIIPAMDLVHQQLKLINESDGLNGIGRLQRGIPALKRSIYDSKVDALKSKQEELTKMDLERNGFVIKNGKEYIRVDGRVGFESMKNQLKDAGLTEAQVNFIALHWNQSGAGGTAPGLVADGYSCANLVVDIQKEGDRPLKVKLHSVFHNCPWIIDMDCSKPMGIVHLSVDVSNLGEEYVL